MASRQGSKPTRREAREGKIKIGKVVAMRPGTTAEQLLQRAAEGGRFRSISQMMNWCVVQALGKGGAQ